MVTRPQPGNPVQTYQSINELVDRVTDLLTVNQQTQTYVTNIFAAITSFNNAVGAVQQALNKEANNRLAGDQTEAIGRNAAISQLSAALYQTIADVRGALLRAIDDESTDRIAAVAAQAQALASLVTTMTARRYEFVPASGRPGGAPSRFTVVSAPSLLGGDRHLLPDVPSAMLASGDCGPVVRMIGAGVLAARGVTACEVGRLYRARFVVQRRSNPSDPTGDTVLCGLAYLNQSLNVVNTVPLRTYPTLITANGRQECEALISASLGLGAGFTPPSSVRFMVPIVITYGLDAITDVEVLDISDVTDAFVLSPPVADFSDRLVTLETADLITRTERLEQEAGTPSKITFGSKGDAAYATIPDAVQTVELLGRQYAGDGGAGFYQRVSGTLPDGADSFTSHGASFLRIVTAPDVVAGMLDSGYGTWNTGLPTSKPDSPDTPWNNGGMPAVTFYDP